MMKFSINWIFFLILYYVFKIFELLLGAVAASMMCVALGTYLSVYPFFMMLPIVLLLRSAVIEKVGET